MDSRNPTRTSVSAPGAGGTSVRTAASRCARDFAPICSALRRPAALSSAGLNAAPAGPQGRPAVTHGGPGTHGTGASGTLHAVKPVPAILVVP